jgi:hypothetical protein
LAPASSLSRRGRRYRWWQHPARMPLAAITSCRSVRTRRCTRRCLIRRRTTLSCRCPLRPVAARTVVLTIRCLPPHPLRPSSSYSSVGGWISSASRTSRPLLACCSSGQIGAIPAAGATRRSVRRALSDSRVELWTCPLVAALRTQLYRSSNALRTVTRRSLTMHGCAQNCVPQRQDSRLQ